MSKIAVKQNFYADGQHYFSGDVVELDDKMIKNFQQRIKEKFPNEVFFEVLDKLKKDKHAKDETAE